MWPMPAKTHDFRADAHRSTEDFALSDDTRCTYAFRACNERRAVKKSGKLHKLCEEHRRRANETQTRSVERRKRKREEEERTRRMASATVAPMPMVVGDPTQRADRSRAIASTPPCLRTTEMSEEKCRAADEEDPMVFGSAAPLLDEEELSIFQALIFGSTNDPD